MNADAFFIVSRRESQGSPGKFTLYSVNGAFRGPMTWTETFGAWVKFAHILNKRSGTDLSDDCRELCEFVALKGLDLQAREAQESSEDLEVNLDDDERDEGAVL